MEHQQQQQQQLQPQAATSSCATSLQNCVDEPTGVEQVPPQVPKSGGRRKNLECPGCAKAYSSVVTLQDHIRRAHPDVSNELHNIVKAGQWRCTQFPCVMGADGCMVVCKSRNELLRHLETHHAIVVDWVETRFDSLADFDKYRVDLRTKGHFLIKATSRRKGRTESEEPFVLFRCNREGQKVDRKNRGDSRNSIKIGTFCTAYLKIFFQKDDTIRCMGSLTHCNHTINYKVKKLDGSISGRLQLIDDDDDDVPEGSEGGVHMEEAEAAGEPIAGTLEELQHIEGDPMHDDGQMPQHHHHQFRPPPQELHVTHEQIPEEPDADADAEVDDSTDDPQSEHAAGGASAAAEMDVADYSAHDCLNALVEDSIWRMQMIQSERSGQRLIFYADALQKMIRGAHETISKTIMEHLQKNKRKQALAMQQSQQLQMQQQM